MPGPVEWQKLKCACGSPYFFTKLHLLHKPGGGMTEAPAGYKCTECGADVDAQGLVRLAELARKRQELVGLAAEIDQEAAAERQKPSPAGKPDAPRG